MSEQHTAEIDALRTLYNASVANGLLLRARHYERRMNALIREQARPIPPRGGRPVTLRRTGIARKTELARTGGLRRKTAMARVAAAKRTVAKQRAQRDTGPSEATKVLLWARASGRCELCRRDLSDGRFPFSRHHRRPRAMGGSSVPWINDITNLLLLCGSATTPDGCHAFVEKNRGEAYDAGWAIRTSSQYLPAELPVMLHDLVYLTADGGYAKGIA